MSRHQWLLTMGLLLTLGGLGLESAMAPAAPAGGQNPPPPAVENAPVVIKTETNLVLVDVIATDKKGNYITDLEKKDFHVFEDDAEQPISTFSREADIQPNAPDHQHYMVLFFDDSTMDPGLQMRAREAAGKFVESTASPNRLMAVVDFGGSLKIAQNFTADGELLKRAVSSVKYAAVNPNAGGGGVQLAAMGAPSLGQPQSDFAARSVLLSIREVAKITSRCPRPQNADLVFRGISPHPRAPVGAHGHHRCSEQGEHRRVSRGRSRLGDFRLNPGNGYSQAARGPRAGAADSRRVQNCAARNLPSLTCQVCGQP